MVLKRLDDDKEGDNNKKKSLALKFKNIKDMELEDEDCQSKSNKNMELMFRKFKEFLRHAKKLQSFISIVIYL